MVKPFKFWGFLNIGNIQFFKWKFETLYRRKTHMREAWSLEVILAINLKTYFYQYLEAQEAQNFVCVVFRPVEFESTDKNFYRWYG